MKEAMHVSYLIAYSITNNRYVLRVTLIAIATVKPASLVHVCNTVADPITNILQIPSTIITVASIKCTFFPYVQTTVTYAIMNSIDFTCLTILKIELFSLVIAIPSIMETFWIIIFTIAIPIAHCV
jgi:hypothetical protein